MAPLYARLRQVIRLAVVGFADDTNLLACGKTTQDYVKALEIGWAVYDE